MKTFDQLSGRQRRAHLRWLRRVTVGARFWTEHDCAFVRGEDGFRYIERLHRAGIVTSAVSKGNMLGIGKRPFRELAVFLGVRDVEARVRYRNVMVRRGGFR